MLESTFRLLQWREKEGQGSLGTVFLIAEGSGKHQQVIAVTAKHVLESFRGDSANIEFEPELNLDRACLHLVR